MLTKRTIHCCIYIIIIFGVTSVFSLIIGQFPWFSNVPHAPLTAQLGGLGVFIISFLAFFLSAHQLTEKWLLPVTYIFLAIGALLCRSRLTCADGYRSAHNGSGHEALPHRRACADHGPGRVPAVVGFEQCRKLDLFRVGDCSQIADMRLRFRRGCENQLIRVS